MSSTSKRTNGDRTLVRLDVGRYLLYPVMSPGITAFADPADLPHQDVKILATTAVIGNAHVQDTPPIEQLHLWRLTSP